MFAFASILLTAFAAFAGAPIWVALIGAAVLFSISLREQRKFAVRFSNLGLSQVLTMAHWQSGGHAVLASGAAFAIGVASRWALLSV
jgi:hypothetical protein